MASREMVSIFFFLETDFISKIYQNYGSKYRSRESIITAWRITGAEIMSFFWSSEINFLQSKFHRTPSASDLKRWLWLRTTRLGFINFLKHSFSQIFWDSKIRFPDFFNNGSESSYMSLLFCSNQHSKRSGYRNSQLFGCFSSLYLINNQKWLFVFCCQSNCSRFTWVQITW